MPFICAHFTDNSTEWLIATFVMMSLENSVFNKQIFSIYGALLNVQFEHLNAVKFYKI